jgi:adenine-specific DNA methylase
LRDKYKVAKQLDARKEEMLWTLEIKRLIADIDYAANQVGELVKVLHALQTNCAETSNKLANVLERIKANISKTMGDARMEMV